jgi:hypothetical protein
LASCQLNRSGLRNHQSAVQTHTSQEPLQWSAFVCSGILVRAALTILFVARRIARQPVRLGGLRSRTQCLIETGRRIQRMRFRRNCFGDRFGHPHLTARWARHDRLDALLNDRRGGRRGSGRRWSQRSLDNRSWGGRRRSKSCGRRRFDGRG